MAGLYPPPLKQADVDTWFPAAGWPAPAEDTFEIALVLGGTVSAGAYTAGVLDFLLEALDAWEQARRSGRDVPQHKVVVRIICGASGGAINGIVFSRILAYQSARGAVDANPLFNTWSDVAISDLLGGTQDKTFYGFLNVDKIQQTAQRVSTWSGPPGPSRPWVSDRLRTVATITNTTGFPYAIQMGGQSALTHSLTSMADWVRFVVEVPGGTPDTIRTWSPDEVALDRGNPNGWDPARDAALATSAFPAVFSARQITRTANFAGYRFACIPGDGTAPTVFRQLVPDWSALLAGAPLPNLTSLNVDGGACNNEPIDIARRALAGGDGRNTRVGSAAHRAVVLIDPFSEPNALGATAPGNPVSSLMRVFLGLIDQARYKPEDMALAEDDSCFSRFLIAPVGPGPQPTSATGGATQPAIGARAIASGSLDSFGAFFDKSFREYDFKLGRYNARRFLEKYFMLPKDNSLFTGRGARNPQPNWIDTENGTDYCAIIPVMSDVTMDPLPAYLPKMSTESLDKIFDAVGDRVDWVFDRVKEMAANIPFAGTYLWVGWKLGGRSGVINWIKQYLTTGLKQHGLL